MSVVRRVLLVNPAPGIQQALADVLVGLRLDGGAVDIVLARSGAQAIRMLSRGDEFALCILPLVIETRDAGLQVIRHVRDRLRNVLVRFMLYFETSFEIPGDADIAHFDISEMGLRDQLFGDSRTFGVSLRASLSAYDREAQLARNKRALAGVAEIGASIHQSGDVNIAAVQVLDRLMDVFGLRKTLSPDCHAGCAYVRNDWYAGNALMLYGTGCFSDIKHGQLEKKIDEIQSEWLIRASLSAGRADEFDLIVALGRHADPIDRTLMKIVAQLMESMLHSITQLGLKDRNCRKLARTLILQIYHGEPELISRALRIEEISQIIVGQLLLEENFDAGERNILSLLPAAAMLCDAVPTLAVEGKMPKVDPSDAHVDIIALATIIANANFSTTAGLYELPATYNNIDLSVAISIYVVAAACAEVPAQRISEVIRQLKEGPDLSIAVRALELGLGLAGKGLVP